MVDQLALKAVGLVITEVAEAASDGDLRRIPVKVRLFDRNDQNLIEGVRTCEDLRLNLTNKKRRLRGRLK